MFNEPVPQKEPESFEEIMNLLRIDKYRYEAKHGTIYVTFTDFQGKEYTYIMPEGILTNKKNDIVNYFKKLPH